MSSPNIASYDALLVLSFGGPEKPDDVIPFLENVLRGRNVARERMLEVAEHYYHFGGRSPINDQNRALISAVRELLRVEGPDVPIYWGNRNWNPYLVDTLCQMRSDGVKRALAFVTSAYSSYSGCRQYREDIARAEAKMGGAFTEIVKAPAFNARPGFIQANADHLRDALQGFDATPRVAFTAHSIPKSMSDSSVYVRQLNETAGLVAEAVGIGEWSLVYQSRSGPPSQPWLEPDIGDYIRTLAGQGWRDLVIAPIGFISDHMEVIYDLDTEAAGLCRELGIRMTRAKTAGTHPSFVRMIRDLLLSPGQVCPPDCCPSPARISASAQQLPNRTV